MTNLYASSILKVDLSTGLTSREPTKPYTQAFVGARGINIKLLFDSLDPKTQALDPENILLFGAGSLVGTPFPGASRTDVMARSPVTGGLGDSNVGGYFGAELKFAGYDNLMITGKATRPVYLYIKDDIVQIMDATDVWGKDTYETPEIIRREVGEPNAQILCIGPAGEHLVLYSCVSAGNGSTAARSGLGAVMGSKNLKAVAVRGTNGVCIARPEAFINLCRKVRDELKQNNLYQDIHTYGLAKLHDGEMKKSTDLMESKWPGSEAISEETFTGKHVIKRVGCMACPVACFDAYDMAGLGSGTIKCSPYGDLSWDVGNSDLAVTLKAHLECQRYGIDSRSMGNMLSWLMDLHEHGIIKAADVDGLPMTRGNREAILALPRKISYREGIGDLLADGLQEAARKIGRGADRFLQLAKGNPMDLHVPAIKNRGLSAALAETGEAAQSQVYLVDVLAYRYLHTDKESFQHAIQKHKERAKRDLNAPDAPDPTTIVGKGALHRQGEERATICDSTGVCSWMTSFMGLPVDTALIASAMSIGLGREVPPQDLAEAAARERHVERAFAAMCGFDRRRDVLPTQYYRKMNKKAPELGFNSEELEKMKDDYYTLMGWDLRTGIPSKATLEHAGLADVAVRLKAFLNSQE